VGDDDDVDEHDQGLVHNVTLQVLKEEEDIR
jgi:hypothetical protein